MVQEVKTAYLTAYALASGGWRNLTEATYLEIGEKVRTELEELCSITEDVQRGRYAAEPSDLSALHLQLRARELVDSVRQAVDWP